jgi:L-histidine N-alpha-methyltransferase
MAAAFEATHFAAAFPEHHTPLHLAEIGPGNGEHSAVFLSALQKEGYRIESYLGLDFSESLMAIAKDRLQVDLSTTSVAFARWDFEGTSTHVFADARPTSGRTTCLLLGHTLGNPESPENVLRHIQQSLSVGDSLTLSVALRGSGPVDDLLLPYLNPVFSAAALEPLRMGGIDTARGEFSLTFDETRSAVVGLFTFREKQILVSTAGSLSFETGDQIRCFLSRRFTAHSIEQLVDRGGWNVRYQSVSESGSHLALTLTVEG